LIVQPKNNFDCLLNLGKKILETIQERNYSVKPEHLLRQAYCENHKSRKKLWILDLDNDSMTEGWVEYLIGGQVFLKREWTVESVEDLVRKHVEAAGKDSSSIYRVPTRNGWHIITPPFNLQEAQKECRLIFEGAKEMPIAQSDYFLRSGDEGYFGSPGLDHKYKVETQKTVGWLHKDGMTLLYSEAPDEKEGNENE
jgi:hypothetical protein